MDPVTAELAMFVIKQIRDGLATLAALKAKNPEAYAHIEEHVVGARDEAQAVLDS